MNLYSYDHCPYCVRARMIFGLKNIPFEHIILDNDDEDTPIDLIGQKMLPILEEENGRIMAESLDIVRHIDDNYGDFRISEDIRDAVEQWRAKVAGYANRLLMPRMVQLNLPEFSDRAAIDYFIAKKSAIIGDFDENMAKTDLYLRQLNADLQELEPLIISANSLNEQLSMEDILIFPILRNCTMIKGVIFPPKVQQYLLAMAQLSNINLFLEKAI